MLLQHRRNDKKYFRHVISDLIEIKDRELIVMYDTERNYRNIDFTDDGRSPSMPNKTAARSCGSPPAMYVRVCAPELF